MASLYESGFEIADFDKHFYKSISSDKAYRVLYGEAPLFGMSHPSLLDESQKVKMFNQLYDEDVRVIINLAKGYFYHNPDPKRFDYEFFPLTQLMLEGPKEVAIFWSAVDYGQKALKSGKGVVIHCQDGTGRTGTVIGCILRQLGKGSEHEVISWLSSLNEIRGRAWPESSIQSGLVTVGENPRNKVSKK